MHTPGSRHRVRAHARRRASRIALTSALPARAVALARPEAGAIPPVALGRPQAAAMPSLAHPQASTAHRPDRARARERARLPPLPSCRARPALGRPGTRPMLPSTLPAAHAGLWRGLPPRLRVLEAAAIDSATIGGPRLRPSPPSHTGLDSHTIRSAAGRRMVKRAPPFPIPATVRPWLSRGHP